MVYASTPPDEVWMQGIVSGSYLLKHTQARMVNGT